MGISIIFPVHLIIIYIYRNISSQINWIFLFASIIIYLILNVVPPFNSFHHYQLQGITTNCMQYPDSQDPYFPQMFALCRYVDTNFVNILLLETQIKPSWSKRLKSLVRFDAICLHKHLTWIWLDKLCLIHLCWEKNCSKRM